LQRTTETARILATGNLTVTAQRDFSGLDSGASLTLPRESRTALYSAHSKLAGEYVDASRRASSVVQNHTSFSNAKC
jgi:hypothetical protein